MTDADWIGVGTLLVLVFNSFQVKRVKTDTKQVHTLVNDRSTKQDQRIEQLVSTIESSNKDVPKHPFDGEVE